MTWSAKSTSLLVISLKSASTLTLFRLAMEISKEILAGKNVSKLVLMSFFVGRRDFGRILEGLTTMTDVKTLERTPEMGLDGEIYFENGLLMYEGLGS